MITMLIVSLAELTERSKDAAEAVRRIVEEIDVRLAKNQNILRYREGTRTGMNMIHHQALGEGVALKRLREWILQEEPKIAG